MIFSTLFPWKFLHHVDAYSDGVFVSFQLPDLLTEKISRNLYFIQNDESHNTTTEKHILINHYSQTRPFHKEFLVSLIFVLICKIVGNRQNEKCLEALYERLVWNDYHLIVKHIRIIRWFRKGWTFYCG